MSFCKDCGVKWAQEMGMCRSCQSKRVQPRTAAGTAHSGRVGSGGSPHPTGGEVVRHGIGGVDGDTRSLVGRSGRAAKLQMVEHENAL